MFANYVKAIQSNLEKLVEDGTDTRAIETTKGMLSDMIYQEYKYVLSVASGGTMDAMISVTASRLGVDRKDVIAAIPVSD
jgi:ribulose 1,5-bisphosphate carboxylase large subunit-like protein